MQRTGSADLPLHGGQVPLWLAARMARLGRVLIEALVIEFGKEEVIRRLADPFWFQSLGCVMGMDWHSSGITTSVIGALKKGINPIQRELGLFICGGRGKHSRRTPDELHAVGERTGLDGEALAHTSRLVAKVDSAAVQDGFDLYLHTFIVTDNGAWTVIQQGMNPGQKQARRYHWLSYGLQSFVDRPHSAIEGPSQGTILNLTDEHAGPLRNAEVELVHRGPVALLDSLRNSRHLVLPAHHEVRSSDVNLTRLQASLTAASQAHPQNFEELLLVRGVGARTLQALALVSEMVYGTPTRFSDPARFSFAHGGKDGHPFPVPLRVYDQTLTVLRKAVEQAKLGQGDKLQALRNLDAQSRILEQKVKPPSLAKIITEERKRSPLLGGKTVAMLPKAPAISPKAPLRSISPQSSLKQLRLPGIDH